ncbi:MAG: aminoacyl-tRNA hydrolase [Chloroflexi bacterium GWB2_54_36]|nr:MAG: aminoacyl-tRNA hydrolase [Chloroflexi bacterium GWB2_54_36]
MLVGLGNPGREYRDSRHNAGFMVIDRLAADLGVKLTRVQNRALTGSGAIGEVKIVLTKPQTYMNLSGESVSGLLRFYKIPHENLIVIHDDIDLPFGVLRMRPGGGSAGQKGVQSIIERIGTQDFPRLRFGIGRPAGPKGGAGYVLNHFHAEEQKELPFLIDAAAAAVRVFVTDGLEAAMNRYNGSQLEE